MKGKAGRRVQDRNGMDSHDPYFNKPDPKDGSYCQKCHAIFHNKHWFFDSEKLKKIRKSEPDSQVLCPACEKIRDNFASGIVTLQGEFLADHGEEIINLIHNEEDRAKGLNPLERIIQISKVPEGMEVTTTHEKLAQKIGKRLHSSFSGEVNYQFSDQEKMARVTWVRN